MNLAVTGEVSNRASLVRARVRRWPDSDRGPQGSRSGFVDRALFHGRRAIFSRGAPNRALARRGLAA
jgi:hypothetical protein